MCCQFEICELSAIESLDLYVFYFYLHVKKNGFPRLAQIFCLGGLAVFFFQTNNFHVKVRRRQCGPISFQLHGGFLEAQSHWALQLSVQSIR